jgi:hypothetical protein
VPRLVSLTNLCTVYPAFELDGSWTEITGHRSQFVKYGARNNAREQQPLVKYAGCIDNRRASFS